MDTKKQQPNLPHDTGAQSHLKIKNFVQKLENDLVEEAKAQGEFKRQLSQRVNVPAPEEHCTLHFAGKESKIPVLRGSDGG